MMGGLKFKVVYYRLREVREKPIRWIIPALVKLI